MAPFTRCRPAHTQLRPSSRASEERGVADSPVKPVAEKADLWANGAYKNTPRGIS